MRYILHIVTTIILVATILVALVAVTSCVHGTKVEITSEVELSDERLQAPLESFIAAVRSKYLPVPLHLVSRITTEPLGPEHLGECRVDEKGIVVVVTSKALSLLPADLEAVVHYVLVRCLVPELDDSKTAER